MLRVVDSNTDRKKQRMSNHEYKGGRGARSIPPTERIEYRNAHWLLENETDGTYGDFGNRINKSRQEIGRLLRRDPQFGISRQMAMRIEEGFGKPKGWLSKDHGFPEPRSQARVAKQPSPFPQAPVEWELTAEDMDFTKPNPNIAGVGYSNHTYQALQSIEQVQERAADIVVMKTANAFKRIGVRAKLTVAKPSSRSPSFRALAKLTTVFEVQTAKRRYVALIEDVELKGIEDEPSDDTIFDIARALITASLAEETAIVEQSGRHEERWLAIYNISYEDKEYIIAMDEARLGLALFDAVNRYKVDSVHELLRILQDESVFKLSS